MRAPCLALLALVLAGCPKHVERVAGTDDSRIDDAAARLEELRLKEQSEDAVLPGPVQRGAETCAVTEELCGLVDAHPDRTDLPPRCVQAREQCAQANAGCERCKNG